MAFTYCPLQNLVGENIISDPIGGELMEHSQRPKVWIFPQTCQGGELTLPFFYHRNWLPITSAQACRDMGTITPCLYSQLVSANGTTGASVVVNVYAWAEDVKLHAPTTSLALQVDEFDYKPSQIASSVASASGALSRIPIIGPYMKATSVVTSAFANVASSLGFTNVPNMETVEAVRSTPYPQNSSCEVSVYSDRSAVDPKNEVSIDPRTVGLDGTDELSIAYLAGKECWIGNAILSSTDAIDALTLVSRVTPGLIATQGPNKPVHYTPMAYVAKQFRVWRGDIIFRFKFICTRFHKGRVRITFDPVNNISTTVPDYATVFNEIVDIGAEQDVEVRVPYSQAATYLVNNVVDENFNLGGFAVTPDRNSNGLITMRVVNPLSGPLANTAIPVMVFVRAAENIEFAQPQNSFGGLITASPFTLQSQEVSYPVKPLQLVAGNATTDGDPNRHLIHYGESVKSFRPLIHRLAYQYSIRTQDLDTGNALNQVISYQTRGLKFGGFDSNGLFTANKILTAGTAPYNYIKFGVHQAVALMFIGQRGSMTHSYNFDSAQAGRPANVQLKRFAGEITKNSYRLVNTIASTSQNVEAYWNVVATPEPCSGTALTDAAIQSGSIMNFPYYSQYNFQLVKPSESFLGSQIDDTNYDHVLYQVTYGKVAANGPVRINVWSACGPDFNFFFFRNTPTLYVYDTPNGA
nr:MAG: hypothetical protein 2 [Marnaviridae sp.]